LHETDTATARSCQACSSNSKKFSVNRSLYQMSSLNRRATSRAFSRELKAETRK
jgi:hypothetical protein